MAKSLSYVINAISPNDAREDLTREEKYLINRFDIDGSKLHNCLTEKYKNLQLNENQQKLLDVLGYYTIHYTDSINIDDLTGLTFYLLTGIDEEFSRRFLHKSEFVETIYNNKKSNGANIRALNNITKNFAKVVLPNFYDQIMRCKIIINFSDMDPNSIPFLQRINLNNPESISGAKEMYANLKKFMEDNNIPFEDGGEQWSNGQDSGFTLYNNENSDNSIMTQIKSFEKYSLIQWRIRRHQTVNISNVFDKWNDEFKRFKQKVLQEAGIELESIINTQ